jgi:hypothetical protein
MAISDIAAGLLGTWRLESLQLHMEDTGEVVEPFGPDPRGSIIFTLDGRMMTVITAEKRAVPTRMSPYDRGAFPSAPADAEREKSRTATVGMIASCASLPWLMPRSARAARHWVGVICSLTDAR